MPSPLGEGQTDTPIITFIWVRSNRHADHYRYLGEAFPSHPRPFFMDAEYKASDLFGYSENHQDCLQRQSLQLMSKSLSPI